MATANGLNNNIENCAGLPVTGLSLAANSAMIVTNGAGIASMTSSMTNGQVVIGDTGGTPVPSTITAGSGISITNAPGSITIASTAGAGGLVNIQYLTTSGTYTPTSGTVSCVVLAVGGGGGGGGCANPSTSNQVAVGAGGGGGAYCIRRYSSVPSGASYTIGTAGNGGAAGNNVGAAGGSTVFNSDFTAGGGAGGIGGAVVTLPTGDTYLAGPTAGGAPSGTYDLAASGYEGGSPFALSGLKVLSGAGGNSYFGPGAPALYATVTGSSSAGSDSVTKGTGGSGARAINASGPFAGGNGSAGMIVVYEYGA